MTRRSEKYTVTLNTPATGKINCGTLVVREFGGNTDGVGFKYSAEYLNHPAAFSIDPIALKLTDSAYQFSINNNLPGFLDDYLPDRWGRKVITRAATISKKENFNANSVIDILSLVSKSNIGAISIDSESEKPTFDLGLEFQELINAENAAQLIDNPKLKIQLEAAKLIHLWRDGSGGVGGARPKSLIHKNNIGYLAKFNSRRDEFNYAKVELACLLMAKDAGIHINGGFIQTDVNGRDVLLLQRFDLLPNDTRLHLLTINSMLKDPVSFIDFGNMFKYDNILQILKTYSSKIQDDVKQLLRLMLFNRAINNIDDHERNFSLSNSGNGYQLSPAYDLVPSLNRGEYHAAGFNYSNYPPKPSEIDGTKRILGVPKVEAKACAEQVINAVEKWTYFAELAGVSEKDSKKISAILNL
ncbi:type II toxin-antitoxin system HipA family toxin [Aliikangiella coralliicola]|uniref:Type II toxin-antitoxin system HipA family toxin n=1 Tax=Aliikangiella coralliicola TaxID=2592383 RepID=A0A545UJW3_9GAMM|nr:type II toxin-antitoxin system HipA family toxin [Aliikangiella coralliicola]TQV89741.1 type II toxin-antitoxin system HipA family toxin [Aliikangiella coralliicola]